MVPVNPHPKEYYVTKKKKRKKRNHMIIDVGFIFPVTIMQYNYISLYNCTTSSHFLIKIFNSLSVVFNMQNISHQLFPFTFKYFVETEASSHSGTLSQGLSVTEISSGTFTQLRYA